MTDPNIQTQPAWYRKLKSPPEDVLYAHKLGRGRLLPYQIDELVKAINPAYVASKGKNTYLAHHQARAEMNRIFGYGNWDVEISDTTLIYEEQVPGSGQNANKLYWRACYRGKSTVIVRDLWGMQVASYQGVHAEANSNLPDRGEAHATALTSLESYALRRALINLGDRFGLGLYNGGSINPHGQYTVQLEPGVLFDWADANLEQAPAQGGAQPYAPAPAPFVQPTHDTINAEPSVGDDYVITESADDTAQEAPAQAVPKAVQRAQANQAGFHAAQQEIQAQNEAARQPGPPQQQGGYPQPGDPAVMQARLQAGFKVDEQGAAGGPANV